ncbi:MAG TPA: phosphotransferase [Microthrixaceae bacterium]|nr:phosphotransferase [Microthrixaceae bacterium]
MSADRHGVEALIGDSGLDATGKGGTPASSREYRVEVERTVAMYASTLARLHDLEVPDDTAAALTVHDPAAIVGEATEAVRSGRVSAEGLSSAYRHMAPERLLEILAERAGHEAVATDDPLVLTHGRPLLERLRCEHGAALGLTGWDRLGLGHPYRDLAVAAREVATGLSPMLVPVLFEAYAAASSRPQPPRPDPVRLDWYVLAAELTP